MKSVFSEDDHSKVDVKRNPFDLSFQNNLTMNFGKLYPVFCKEVVPGDGFKIDAKFALNLLPMVFPVQTKMQARLDFYYCRNRAMWSDWKDFIYHTKDGLESPYLSFGNEKQLNLVTTGSLGDYLNLPTQRGISDNLTAYTSAGSNVKFRNGQTFNELWFDNSNAPRLNRFLVDGASWWNSPFFPNGVVRKDYMINILAGRIRVSNTGTGYEQIESLIGSDITRVALDAPSLANVPLSTTDGLFFLTPFNPSINGSGYTYTTNIPWTTFGLSIETVETSYSLDCTCVAIGVKNDGTIVRLSGDTRITSDYRNPYGLVLTGIYNPQLISQDDLKYVGWILTKITFSNVDLFFAPTEVDDPSSSWFGPYTRRDSSQSSNHSKICRLYVPGVSFGAGLVPSFNPLFAFDGVMTANPFVNGRLRVSALPFRAYEAIYNCWYRNEKVMPFVLNGQVEYNRFNTALDGGADDTEYDFYYHNWEKDFLTTCLPSPQQGDAPLVGVRVQADDSFEIEVDGVTRLVRPILGSDGETVTGIDTMNEELPEGAMQILQNRINRGFSINDLRAVDSFQRWLETNLRRGYKYRDLIYAHTGERIHFNELDMPEYLGGVSDVINVNKIVNTNGDGVTPLGEFAGLGSLFSGLQNGINVHCDEHGFIMGIFSVVPVPVYTQLCPKFFLKFNELDYYNKEFQRIGMQPVFYSEVSPNERYFEETRGQDDVSLEDVFGYQRPFYEYMSSQDEAHGLFRSSLRNYVLSRYFDGSPELGENFIVTNVSQLNDVFPTTYEQGDKILGQIYFDVIANRPMLRQVTPGL